MLKTNFFNNFFILIVIKHDLPTLDKNKLKLHKMFKVVLRANNYTK